MTDRIATPPPPSMPLPKGKQPKGIQKADQAAALGIFERGLSLWVFLAIVLGVWLGNLVPEVFATLAGLEVYHVNVLVGGLIWVMIYPMMVAVDFSSLGHLGARPKGLVITLVVNWLIKPFTMAGLGLLFFGVVFASWITPSVAQSLTAGLILLGAAPCTAMVFVWSRMIDGDPTYTLVQVAVNDLVMLVAFAPLVALLLAVTEIAVPWPTLLLSVVLYVMIPLAAGVVTRRYLGGKGGPRDTGDSPALARFNRFMKPWSALGLILMVVLLFGFHGQTVLANPLLIVLISVPLLIQSYGIFALAFAWARWWRVPFPVAAPAALIGTSNFFELAVAVAIGLFGLSSPAALATVVGVLVEVPVMLSLVSLSRRMSSKFP